MSDAQNMTGLWSGEYHYPGGWKPTMGFTAILNDSGGALSGSISERSDVVPGGYERADILGTRDGAEVAFTKMYDDSGAHGHAVAYSGTINAAGTEVSGAWTLEGVSGTFSMWRQFANGIAQERQAIETLDIPAGT